MTFGRRSGWNNPHPDRSPWDFTPEDLARTPRDEVQTDPLLDIHLAESVELQFSICVNPAGSG